jgi:methionyl-tRNA formyltransferase
LLANQAGIPVIRAASVYDEKLIETLKAHKYDLVFMGGGWPEKLPSDFTSIAPLGALNTHPSLLPQYRGTSITRWQVLHGVTKSGVTIHVVDSNFDSGPIVAQAETRTGPNDTPQELFQKLAVLGASLAREVLADIQNSGAIPPVTIPERGNYFPRWVWNEELMNINPNEPLRQINSFILAHSQEEYRFAGPRIRINNQEFYVRESEIAPDEHNSQDYKPKVGLIQARISKKGFLEVRRLREPNILIIKRIQRVGRGVLGFRAEKPGCFFPRDMKVAIHEP